MPPPLANVGYLGVEILNASRRWARTRNLLRRALDSKSATKQQVDARRREYEKMCHELEVVVGRLERVLKVSGKNVPMNKRPKDTFPWQKLFGMIATGARAAEEAVSRGETPTIIDVTGETTKE